MYEVGPWQGLRPRSGGDRLIVKFHLTAGSEVEGTVGIVAPRSLDRMEINSVILVVGLTHGAGHFKNRQIHGHDQTADGHSQKDQHKGFDQGR